MKAKLTSITLALMSALLLSSCNFGEEIKESKLQTVVSPVTETADSEKTENRFEIGDHVPNELVCMVNDAYMAKAQIPIGVNGKTYYGCCNMCVETLNKEETARLAIDPVTGEKVDKSEAFIVLLSHEGQVAYYKSETTFKKSLEAGNP